MFTIALWLMACTKEGEAPALPGEPPERDYSAIAVLTFQGVGLGGPEVVVSYLWFAFANPAAPEPPEPEPETCWWRWDDEMWFDEPVPLDAGEITVRIDTLLPLDPGPNEDLYNFTGYYPVGEKIWFEATGGTAFPAFQVPELVEVPEPLLDLSFAETPDGLRFDWISPGDDAITEVIVSGSSNTLTCRAGSGESFLITEEQLEDTELGDIESVAVTRSHVAEVIVGDVLVRGIAVHRRLEGL